MQNLVPAKICTFESILRADHRPRLSSCFLCDLFLEFEGNTNDTISYTVGDIIEGVNTELTNVTQKLFTWFSDNPMTVNHGKCHLLLCTLEPLNIQICWVVIFIMINSKVLNNF